MSYKFFLSLFILVSHPVISWSACSESNQYAKRDCDKSNFQGTQAEFTKAMTAITQGMAQGLSQGTAQNGLQSQSQMQGLSKEMAEFISKCSAAIQKCDDDCEKEKENAIKNNETFKVSDIENKQQECTRGEPKQALEQAKDTNNSLADLLNQLGQMLAQLMSSQDEEQQEETKPGCDDPEYKRINAVECNVDKAATNGNNFASGDYRNASGKVVDGNDAFLQGEPQAGDPGQNQGSSSQQSGVIGTGAPGGSSSSPVGVASKEKDKGSNNGEGGTANKAGGYMNGGGGSKGYGGGGIANAGHNGAAVVSSSSNGNSLQQAIANKLAARDPASHGPPGGITGPLSADNFQKIERRVELERNSLNEL